MLYVDDKYIPVQAGTGIFYDKNQPQSYYGCGETEFNHDYVFFDLNNEIEKNVFSMKFIRFYSFNIVRLIDCKVKTVNFFSFRELYLKTIDIMSDQSCIINVQS